MIYRYNRFLVLLLMIILLYGYGYQAYGSEKLTKQIVSEKAIKQETNSYLINVKYPQTINRSINKAINLMMLNAITTFKHDIGTERISPNWRNELWCNYTTMQYSSRIGSIRFDIYTFTGGAHGNTQVVTKTYDYKTGKEIRLSDIFNSKTDYLTQIANRVQPILTRQLENPTANWFESGTAPTAKNYQAFMLTPSSIIFIFQQYQVAPRVEGMPEVVLSWNQIKNILNPQFKLQN
jgi:hypothetical protein